MREKNWYYGAFIECNIYIREYISILSIHKYIYTGVAIVSHCYQYRSVILLYIAKRLAGLLRNKIIQPFAAIYIVYIGGIACT